MTSNKLSAPAGFLNPLTIISSNAPAAGEVLVVVARLDIFPEVTVSAVENKHADSINSQETKLRFLAGRRLLRGTLSGWLEIAPEEISLIVGEGGKPFLSELADLHFSISHSGDLVMIAFASSPLGVDLESERSVDTVALARRFFSWQEASLVESDGTNEGFFRLWTCREAAIKGDGRGMSALLKTTRVLPGDEVPLRVVTGKEEWNTYPWKMDGGYHGALALRGKPSLISWCDLR